MMLLKSLLADFSLLCEKSGEQRAASNEISNLLLRLICSPNVIATFLYCQGAQLSTNKMQISVLDAKNHEKN